MPQEIRFEGDQVRNRRIGKGVLLRPIVWNIREWFAALDRLNTRDFTAEGRNQPVAPRRKFFQGD